MPRCRYEHYNRQRASKTVVLDRLITVREAAELLGRPAHSIRALVRRGQLRAERLFGRVLIYRAEIDGITPQKKATAPEPSLLNSERLTA